MPELNQYAISKILGSTMRPVKRPRFSGFGVLETTAEAMKAIIGASDNNSPLALEDIYTQDKVIAQAFEEVRKGVSPESILWDSDLANRFHQRCRELGLALSDATLNYRLNGIRKDPKRYRKHGITLSRTTKSSPHESVVPQYAYVIEFSLVRLRYSRGASIDDILLDPALGSEFERVARQSAPQLSGRDLRLGALYIRKTRYLDKKDAQDLDSLDPGVLGPLWKKPGSSLGKLDMSGVPSSPGLLELKEHNRYLYIASNSDIRAMASQFQGGHAFESVANGFWKPNPDEITLQYIPGTSIEHVNAARWERRLIHDREPVLNWPVVRKGKK